MRELLQDRLRNRDVSIIETDLGLVLASIDMATGIGVAPLDKIKADIFDVAYFVARTAAAELLSLNVPVLSMSIGTSLPFGSRQRINGGIHYLLDSIESHPALVFSHENYIESLCSCISVSAIGYTRLTQLVCKPIEPGVEVYCYGEGYVHSNIRHNDNDMPDLCKIMQIVSEDINVRQVIPVGSRGIQYDIDTLTRANRVALCGSCDSFTKRGGPGLQFLILTDSVPDLPSIKYVGVLEAV